MIADSPFNNKIPLFERLAGFGFVRCKETYIYTCPIADNQFTLIVLIDPNGQVRTRVIDPDTEEEYTLHLSQQAAGSFVGKVRTAFFAVLQAIAENCFEKKIFRSDNAAKIIRYINEQYQNQPEYLWEKFPENAVIRRTDNRKWYAVLLSVEKNKIGLNGSEKTEILNLKAPPEKIKQLVDGKKYFPAWHMNKKHWITLHLKSDIDWPEIAAHIDESYRLAKT
ncbi:MAG: MmcQ/YjbR family DNA-binding protein [Oxalobacter formigenes]|nr:MmcQ/YjbR family DNA-binding protein [Oxalobacter formigenes]